MSKRHTLCLALLLPLLAPAQQPTPVVYNASTLAVILANKPDRFTQAEWLRMMQEPMNRSLYPLRVTQAMLDTLDARQLDARFQYVMVAGSSPMNTPQAGK
jgi:hypothetical protein